MVYGSFLHKRDYNDERNVQYIYILCIENTYRKMVNGTYNYNQLRYQCFLTCHQLYKDKQQEGT